MDTPGLSLIVYGVILIAIIGYFPDGLIGIFKRRRRPKPIDA
jgi:ABC-type branched-subunit amino acid transport system permease subunit